MGITAQLDIAADQVYPGYLAGLMQFRRTSPPPLLPAHFGGDAPLVGAIEEAFSAVLTDEGLRAWSSNRRPRSRPGRPKT
jgi:hypothetical protein